MRYPIAMTNRSSLLILWLVCAAVDAAPLGNTENEPDPGLEPSIRPTEHMRRAPAESSLQLGEGEDAIERRLRIIIDELRRQGPPPVGCMEG